MTTESQAKEIVYQEFISLWAGETEVTLENESFTPANKYVRITIRQLGSNQRTLGRTGNRKFRRDALVLIQVFTPADTGTGESDRLSKLAANIFEGKRLNGLSFGSVSSRGVGPSGSWYQALVEAPFDYDEIK